MEYYLSFILASIVLDFSIIYIINRLFCLGLSKLELILLSIFSIIPALTYVFLEFWVGYYYLMKLGFYLFISIFITDKLSLKRVLSIFASAVVLMFSVFGFCYLFVLYIRALFFELFKLKLKSLYDVVIITGLFVYIMLLLKVFNIMSKKKKINNFLAKVSFSLFGRHIEITGLIDSGNSLHDTKTKKPVIIVPLAVLKKYLSESECNMISAGNYFGLNISHEVEYVSVGGAKGRMPISDIGEASVKWGDKTENQKCVVGIVCENLTEDKDYDCLLHRDFL